MTDRELLELAAKAAGIEFNNKRSPTSSVALYFGPSVGWWNPLTDDGDALRLAVKLGIVPRRINKVVFAWCDGVCDMQEPINDDPYAATRRAIVRAAVEIGRAMP